MPAASRYLVNRQLSQLPQVRARPHRIEPKTSPGSARVAVSVSDAVEGYEGGGVGGGEGVQVFLRGGDGLVAESFADGLEIGAAGEEPGGVGVAQVVHSRSWVEVGGGAGGVPDLGAPVVAGQVSVGGGSDPGAAGLVESGESPVGAVGGERCSAVAAAAVAGGVSGQGAVPVSPAGGVGIGESEVLHQGQRCRCQLRCRDRVVSEEQVVRAELVLGDVVAYCGYQGGVEPEPAGAFAFGVGLDQESVAGGVIVRVEFDHGAGDGEDAGGGVEVSGAEFDEFAPAQPGADRDLDQQPRRIVGQGEQKAADFVGGVRMRYSLTGTVGVLTPLQGCRLIT